MQNIIPLKELFQAAISAAATSYSPYSHFRVGAALYSETGDIIIGTNVENRSYGLTNCAERSAVFTAISLGKTRFSALAIHCPDADYHVPPCGACRQVLSEFVAPDFPIYFSGKDGDFIKKTMGELLPADSLRELKTRTGP